MRLWVMAGRTCAERVSYKVVKLVSISCFVFFLKNTTLFIALVFPKDPTNMNYKHNTIVSIILSI